MAELDEQFGEETSQFLDNIDFGLDESPNYCIPQGHSNLTTPSLSGLDIKDTPLGGQDDLDELDGLPSLPSVLDHVPDFDPEGSLLSASMVQADDVFPLTPSSFLRHYPKEPVQSSQPKPALQLSTSVSPACELGPFLGLATGNVSPSITLCSPDGMLQTPIVSATGAQVFSPWHPNHRRRMTTGHVAIAPPGHNTATLTQSSPAEGLDSSLLNPVVDPSWLMHAGYHPGSRSAQEHGVSLTSAPTSPALTPRRHRARAASSASTTFICDRCERPFRTQAELNHHRRRYKPYDQRPYKCPECNKRFLYFKELCRHSATHMSHDQRQFACSSCTKRFGRRDHLDRHLATHSRSSSFSTPPNNFSTSILSSSSGSLGTFSSSSSAVIDNLVVSPAPDSACPQLGSADFLPTDCRVQNLAKPHKSELTKLFGQEQSFTSPMSRTVSGDSTPSKIMKQKSQTSLPMSRTASDSRLF